MAFTEAACLTGKTGPGTGPLWAWPVLLFALAIGGASACAQGFGPNYGHDFGTISLAAGRAQQVWIGPSYRLLQVCNDFGSSATIAAVIDDQPSTTLPPGRCTQDYGNRIQFTNTGSGAAKLTYRTIFEPFTP